MTRSDRSRPALLSLGNLSASEPREDEVVFLQVRLVARKARLVPFLGIWFAVYESAESQPPGGDALSHP